MKRTILSLALLPLVACAPDYDRDGPDQQNSETSAIEAQGPYLAAAERRLDELEAEVAEIKQEVAARTTEASEDLGALIVSIDEKRQAAVDEIVALKDTGEGAWVSAGESLEQALDVLEQAIDEAWNRIRA